MNPRLHLLILFAAALSIPTAAQSEPEPPTFSQLLTRIATYTPDICEPDPTQPDDVKTETAIFDKAIEAVLTALNTAPTTTNPKAAAAETLRRLEQQSAQINAAWPDGNRLHLEFLERPPTLVLKLTIRSYGRFFVLAVPQRDYDQHPNHLWRSVGEDEPTGDSRFNSLPAINLELHPLHRGPNGRARFLANIIYPGCAGSMGGVYDAREWDPTGTGSLTQIIQQPDAIGLEDDGTGKGSTRKNPFGAIGKLRIQGRIITLPFCWFSAIDTWDNPSLCALDTYDLSSNTVHFISRAYNRPDLIPIAKAIEHASQHDYPATLAYCASPAVARQLIREPQTTYGAGDLHVTHISPGKERVDVGDSEVTRYMVEKHGRRWLIVSIE